MKRDQSNNTYNNLKISSSKSVKPKTGTSGLNIPNPQNSAEDKNSQFGEKEKKKIADAMDAFHQKIEMTPGGEQSDPKKS